MSRVQLWLLRHGEAEPHGSAPDFQRALTAKGEDQSRQAGAALARMGIAPAACYSSPKVRARETARLACASLGVGVEEADSLAGDFDVGALRDLLSGHDGGDCVLIVGHEPDFSQLVHDLTARVDVKKGGLVQLAIEGRRGELISLLRPRQITTMVSQ